MNDLTLEERLKPAEPLSSSGVENAVNIVEYWRALAKRRWSIAGLTILVSILAVLIVSNMRPQYRASATLLIEQGKNKVVSIEEVYSQGMIQREYYQTQVEILKSEDLARKVVRKLKLASHPDFDPRQEQRSWYNRIVGSGDSPTATEEQAENVAIGRVKRGLQVGLVRNSQLAQVSFSTFDRELAAKVPNTVADTYIESDLDARMAMTQKASEWLRERMSELKTKVDSAEKALQDYRDRERIVDTKGLAMSGAGRQLEELTKSLVQARQKRCEAERA